MPLSGSGSVTRRLGVVIWKSSLCSWSSPSTTWNPTSKRFSTFSCSSSRTSRAGDAPLRVVLEKLHGAVVRAGEELGRERHAADPVDPSVALLFRLRTQEVRRLSGCVRDDEFLRRVSVPP